MKLLILSIMALATTSAFASEGQFSNKLDGSYTLVKATGTDHHLKDCYKEVSIKVNEDNTLELSQNKFNLQKISFSNSCNGVNVETCTTSTEESYEISREYIDDGMNMKGTAGSKIALGAFDKDKLIIKGYDYLNALRFVGASVGVTCTYKRQ